MGPTIKTLSREFIGAPTSQLLLATSAIKRGCKMTPHKRCLTSGQRPARNAMKQDALDNHAHRRIGGRIFRSLPVSWFICVKVWRLKV